MNTPPSTRSAGTRRPCARRRRAAAALVALLTAVGCAAGGGRGSAPGGSAAATSVPLDGRSPAGVAPGASIEAGARPPSTAPTVTGAFLASGTAPPERSIAVSAQGLSPAVLEVAAGEIVTFAAGDGGSYSIVVGDLAGATIAGGLVSTYGFASSGTYPALEELSGAGAAIVVR